MASLTKKVEISNNHQRVTAEALEQANLDLTGAKDAYQFLEDQIKWHVDELQKARREVEVATEEAVKDYIAIFHLSEEY